MAVYQVPQFLDSGDKIFLNMTLWQLGYLMTAFFISVGTFSFVNGALPGLGIYAFIPVLPVMGLGTYLALGKFNGRDSDIYVLKFVLLLTRPRQMTYQHQPDTIDIDKKLLDLTPEKMNKVLLARIGLSDDKKEVDFAKQKADEKARKIRQIGNNLDTTYYNSLEKLKRKQLEIYQKEEFLKNLEENNTPNSVIQKFTQSVQSTASKPSSADNHFNFEAATPKSILDSIKTENDAYNQNIDFFSLDKNKVKEVTAKQA